MFWGGERLREELGALISDYDPARLDHASYRLRVGPEVYVSPTGEPDDPRNKPKTQLVTGQGFTIPAGQFGFILTEETVRVPVAAIAFISIRAGYKFRGLVNVSGFHVDPHYEGRLIFSVFNAGPGPVHLSRGEPCFLIWYAAWTDGVIGGLTPVTPVAAPLRMIERGPVCGSATSIEEEQPWVTLPGWTCRWKRPPSASWMTSAASCAKHARPASRRRLSPSSRRAG